ncbi:MAG TPA: hypothetical protein VFO18_02150 [Methylomirabilota bacterium]|nr:hypothetical protein [Methylomirabilota bacterium]
MAIQAPDPDFGQNKCPDCDAIMKPVQLTTQQGRSVNYLECPKCGRKIKEPGPSSPSRPGR